MSLSDANPAFHLRRRENCLGCADSASPASIPAFSRSVQNICSLLTSCCFRSGLAVVRKHRQHQLHVKAFGGCNCTRLKLHPNPQLGTLSVNSRALGLEYMWASFCLTIKCCCKEVLRQSSCHGIAMGRTQLAWLLCEPFQARKALALVWLSSLWPWLRPRVAAAVASSMA